MRLFTLPGSAPSPSNQSAHMGACWGSVACQHRMSPARWGLTPSAPRRGVSEGPVDGAARDWRPHSAPVPGNLPLLRAPHIQDSAPSLPSRGVSDPQKRGHPGRRSQSSPNPRMNQGTSTEGLHPHHHPATPRLGWPRQHSRSCLWRHRLWCPWSFTVCASRGGVHEMTRGTSNRPQDTPRVGGAGKRCFPSAQSGHLRG